jgi:LPXTG-motif cell wall-anchored protein
VTWEQRMMVVRLMGYMLIVLGATLGTLFGVLTWRRRKERAMGRDDVFWT